MDHQSRITESELECMLFDQTADPKPLPFSLLERITHNFSYKMEIGRGGFAVVYKAMLDKGVVAVKRSSNTYMYETEFFREVECLMKVKHKNIIRFLGYCVDTQGHMRMHEGKYVMADIQQRLLCFEYMPNGSLDHYIKDPSCGLEWIDRYRIIKGICEGIRHLHELDIVHLDLKPANILLDEKMEPKITDFGISRSFEEDQTRFIATKMPGTMGYMAPEFVSKLITKKYDLYSLGVIILEIVTGERTCQDVESVLKSWSDRLDTSNRNKKCEQIQVCVEIGIECTNFDQEKRPFNMKNIIERLPEMEWTEEKGMAKLLYDEKGWSIEDYNDGVGFNNMDRVKLMKISGVPHITLSDLQKLNCLISIQFKRCDHKFFAELNDTALLYSVVNLHIEELQIAGELFSKVLRCFPALSQLTITKCKNLELLCVEDGGLSDLRLLQSFTGYNCGNLLSRWPMGEVGRAAHVINPFPPSLRKFECSFEPSMQSMGLLLNLTSLTNLRLAHCREIMMDGFNPLITVNLKKLVIDAMSSNKKDISIARDLLFKIARSKLMHAGSFQFEEFEVDSISAVLTAPICTHLAATLRTLEFSFDQQVTAFTEEQEQALQLLTSLQYLEFRHCLNLQYLPQGLHGLSSLKRLQIYSCEAILSLPPKEGLPTSLENLEVEYCSPGLTEQALTLRARYPWFLVKILDAGRCSHKHDTFLALLDFHLSYSPYDSVGTRCVLNHSAHSNSYINPGTRCAPASLQSWGLWDDAELLANLFCTSRLCATAWSFARPIVT